MVLQSPLLRDLHGGDRLRDANSVGQERPLQRTLLCGPILLHRRRSRLLLRSHICPPIKDDSTPRQGALSRAAETDPVDIHHLRCDCDHSADSGCRSGWIGLFESQESQHIQQYPVGRSRVPGLRLSDLCDIVLLVLIKGMERHVFADEAVRHRDNGCDLGSVSENMLSTGGNSAGEFICSPLYI